jgi:hypothetical protein
VLKVFAGQLNSGTGDDFVRRFLSDLSTTAAEAATAQEAFTRILDTLH